LYDSRAVYEDQVASVEKASKNRVAGPIDFSLFTDGLKAEREQGITIDVAYRYFATARRKFILADTPGHEQYTRNMATGASTADVAVLLVDARNGVRTQSRRHARIARLLGINDFVLAINKMDLVDFDRGVLEGNVDDFEDRAGANCIRFRSARCTATTSSPRAAARRGFRRRACSSFSKRSKWIATHRASRSDFRSRSCCARTMCSEGMRDRLRRERSASAMP
jgi:small GTP-binding protein